MSAGQGVGHAPVPDPTRTFCTVDGCLRFLNRRDPVEHRRGSGGRRRYGDDKPKSIQTPIADVMPLIARIDARLAAPAVNLDGIEIRLGRLERGMARVLEQLEVVLPVVRGSTAPTDELPVAKQLAKMRGDLRALASRIDRLAARPEITHRRIADGGAGGIRERQGRPVRRRRNRHPALLTSGPIIPTLRRT
jgi:hypothetical protein